MATTEIAGHESSPPPCRSCGRAPRWESIVDSFGERWLAVCGCGRYDAFLIDQPSVEHEDPLTVFLAGPNRQILPATPPWIRLFKNSLELPHQTRWQHLPGGCPHCAAKVTFATQFWPLPDVNFRHSLCLNCGYVVVIQTRPGGRELDPVDGSDWAPPCPAVKLLRRAISRTRPARGEDWDLIS